MTATPVIYFLSFCRLSKPPQPPIVKLRADNASLKRDQMKFTGVIVHNRTKVEKYKEAVKTLNAEITAQGKYPL